MTLNNSDYERIEAFLQGALSEREAETMRRRIDSDPDFAASVDWVRDFLGLMKDKQSQQVLETFQRIHGARQQRLRRYKTGAAILLLLLISWLLIWLFRNPPQRERPTMEEDIAPTERPEASDSADAPIAWQELVEYDSGVSPLGAEEEEALAEAYRLLGDGQPRAALPYLDSYLNNLPPEEEDFSLRLEAGKIYLKELSDADQAARYFNRVLQSDALPPYKEEARYHLALTELARGDKAAAGAILRPLAEEATEPAWREKATQLLEQLQ